MEEEILKQIANFGVALTLPALVCYVLYLENRGLKKDVADLNKTIQDILIKQIESEDSRTATSKELISTMSDFMVNMAMKRVTEAMKEGDNAHSDKK